MAESMFEGPAASGPIKGSCKPSGGIKTADKRKAGGAEKEVVFSNTKDNPKSVKNDPIGLNFSK